MKCIFCKKTLKRFLRVDFVGRDIHFNCIKLQEIQQNNRFIKWLKQHIQSKLLLGGLQQ